MEKLDARIFAGRCAIPNNPELARYETIAKMTPEQRFHAGFPIEFQERESSPVLQYEREARYGRQVAYKRLLRNY